MTTQPTSLFSEIMSQQNIKQKDSEKEFEDTMNKRGDGIFLQMSHISEIKQDEQTKEIARNQMERERGKKIK